MPRRSVQTPTRVTLEPPSRQLRDSSHDSHRRTDQYLPGAGRESSSGPRRRVHQAGRPGSGSGRCGVYRCERRGSDRARDEDMAWLVEVVQDAVDLPLSLDSPDPAVLEQAYALADKPPIINSISLETERWEAMMPFLRGKECEVIALCMDDTGLPESAEAVAERAQRLIKGLKGVGFPEERIH